MNAAAGRDRRRFFVPDRLLRKTGTGRAFRKKVSETKRIFLKKPLKRQTCGLRYAWEKYKIALTIYSVHKRVQRSKREGCALLLSDQRRMKSAAKERKVCGTSMFET